MLYSQFLKSRRSIREFKNKKVDPDLLEKLMFYAGLIENEYGDEKLKFVLFEDGEKVYNLLKGEGGYSGVMIESPHYIGIQIEDDDFETVINAAYCAELLITKAHNFGLGTCWINIVNVNDQVKKEMGLDITKKMDYIIALGYSNENKPFNILSTSSRLGIEDIVFSDNWGEKIDLDELENRGLKELFYYVRYAPSNKNNQPWRFILKDNKVELAVLNPQLKENLTDIGIMMYYFEHMAHDTGIDGKWNFAIDKNCDKCENEYMIVGEFNI